MKRIGQGGSAKAWLVESTGEKQAVSRLRGVGYLRCRPSTLTRLGKDYSNYYAKRQCLIEQLAFWVSDI